jgi:hypothetical protein
MKAGVSPEVRLLCVLVFLLVSVLNGCASTSQTSNGVIPNIASITPSSAHVGDVVVIAGTNFGNTQGTSIVSFNGTVASASSWSTTSISAKVPSGATTGDVVVTAASHSSNRFNFVVMPDALITSLNPSSGPVGTLVTITGANFGAMQGTSTVTFNGTAASVTNWSATSIVATVPSGATTGKVIVSVGGDPSNGVVYTVTTAAPTIAGLNPTSGLSGTAVVITGTNFGSTQGTSTVTFNGAAATVTGWSATNISTAVPTGATTGPVVVTVNGRASNGMTFTISAAGPTIATVTPNSGVPGTAVTITGTNFGASQGTSTVTFNGTAATATAWSATSITATVPTGATTGNVVVAVGGQASNGVAFTVSVNAPTITSLNPTSGAIGSAVVITGTNFGATQGTSTVTFNGTAATATAWSATSITATVPTGATTGNVVVAVGGQASNSVAFTVASGSITVSVSPKRAGLTIAQTLSVTATTNDSAGVKWSATGGSFSAVSSLSGEPITYSAPATAGSYTITATSSTDNTKSAALTIGVTDLQGVATYHNNLLRDGTNTQEYALNPTLVTSSTFGKLFSCAIDGPAYAQPLWVRNLGIGGGSHNVVFVASVHNTVYAFDADNTTCTTYWSKSLLNSGETYLSSTDTGSGDIEPDVGIIGTPVIDLSTNTMYVVSKSKDSGTSCTPSSSCHQRLHALALIDGSEKFGAPYDITASITFPGNGDGSTNGLVPFDPLRENQRPGLALVSNVVYITWASHGDNGPYHGWVIGFAANNIGAGPTAVWNSTPNGSPAQGGIWMSGGAPASDSSNDLYFLTGNGTFDANSGGSDYGESTIRWTTSGGLHVKDYFTPSNQSTLNGGDVDHGAGGAAVLVDPSAGPVPHLLIGGGKFGTLYLVNRDNMGKYSGSTNPDNVVQSLSVGSQIFATPAFWNNSLYIASVGGTLHEYAFNTSTGQFALSHSSSNSFRFPGATPSISSTGTSNGVVWALDNSQYCTEQSPGCGPAVLHAYDATNVGATELWNSAGSGNDSAGNAVKFTVPTVANGKVYVGTRTELTVYGLKPN